MLSLGGGTQSSVLALMAERGYFDGRPDVAVFADTGWEPPAVYQHLDWLEDQLSFPVVTVRAKGERSLMEDVHSGVNARGRKWLTIPAFLKHAEGADGGMNWRQCTTDYKIGPIIAEARRRMGLRPRAVAPPGVTMDMWLGISSDEIRRMRTAQHDWIVNRYPLIDAGMSREDCIEWFTARYPGRTLPRSACIGCPYRSPREWIDMQANDPSSFAHAVDIDTAIRLPGHNNLRATAYLHPRRIPLAAAVQADLAGDDHGGDSGWGSECAGICGV